MVDFSGFDNASFGQQELLVEQLERASRNDTGQALRETLNAGHPVVYMRENFQQQSVLREYPDGTITVLQEAVEEGRQTDDVTFA